jgi:pimeloyl-ACP methyl ester carboxylesterase
MKTLEERAMMSVTSLFQLEKIDAGLPGGAQLTLLPDCGHSPFRDRPTETLQAIAKFLQDQHF